MRILYPPLQPISRITKKDPGSDLITAPRKCGKVADRYSRILDLHSEATSPPNDGNSLTSWAKLPRDGISTLPLMYIGPNHTWLGVGYSICIISRDKAACNGRKALSVFTTLCFPKALENAIPLIALRCLGKISCAVLAAASSGWHSKRSQQDAT